MPGNNIGSRHGLSSMMARARAAAQTNTTPGKPHHPDAPAHEGARSLGTHHHENTKAELPHEKHRLKRRDEGLAPGAHQFNSPQVMASNNFPDVKVNGEIAGAVIKAMDPGHGGLSLGTVDHSAPASYRSDLTERLGVSKDSYNGAANTKAEYGVERQSYIHKFKGAKGDPGYNNVVLNERKKGYAYVNEKQNGQVALEAGGELAYTAAAARTESRHEGKYGKTAWKAGVEGPFAKVGGEAELRASTKKGQEALAAHTKLEVSTGLFNASAAVDHKFGNHFAVGAHAFAQASASASAEASVVADRNQGTYMAKISNANIAGVQAGVGASLKARPFQGDFTVAKLGGVGHVFNVGGGMNRGVASAVLDLGGAFGPGGRVRAGVSVDTVEAMDPLRDLYNRKTNPNYSQKVRDYSKPPSLEERGQYQRQMAAENQLFQAAWANRPAPRIQLKNELPEVATGSLGIDVSKIGT
ncbi:hypothetical protein [Cystobacter ferrugineus]|uniref:Uncharacterized protein n=1 Tax=Cystobacter ferrugineus TaxID=83449 RepID=A0A1L9B977_9BACT|nr:hypothetical protein [Cystobacter ferrugineus]OJH38805.1 hypothetical protein BON30_21500 [Cystobacter ferrugineus]